MFENNGHIHVYSVVAGADNINFLLIWLFPAFFFFNSMNLQPFSTFKNIGNQILPLNRSRSTQGHHLYIICRAQVNSMLHAKFQDHLRFGSEDEGF